MKYGKLSLLVAVGLTLAMGLARAAEPSWPKESYNRKPTKDDLVLPMPCGGAMVFRPVDIPGGDVFADQKVMLGGGRKERAFIENPHPGYVGGTFEGKDSWRYYLAKYELTAAQYQALTGACPDPKDMDLWLPQVNITPAEAMGSAEKYSVWLFENAQDALPREGESLGFIRLPTEVEWEYAARGGAKVGPADFAAPLPPMTGPAAGYIWYDGTDSADRELQLVGLLEPNPLGLHDMIGNAAELVDGVFHLNRVGRPHGRAGAYIKRGGDYRTSLQAMHSGLREEFTPFTRKGLRREKTTGTRFLLAAPTLSSDDLYKKLQAEWGGLSEQSRVALGEEQSDPRKELQTLSEYTSALDFPEKEEVKRRLMNLVGVLDANIATRNEERDRVAREMLRVAVFAAGRLPKALDSVQTCEKLMALNPEQYKDRCDRVQTDTKFDSDYYLDHLTQFLSEFPLGLILKQAGALGADLRSRGMVEAEGRVPKVVEDLKTLAEKGAAARDSIIEGWGRP
ncbi:formylglycine-generating enzyme family protein [Rhodospirillum sp. A1_3_36]|uniref:formylglycine-generating enzyme family protein n=1 Tax=Rhodospirillum sp. A1_3_36 TaxID=3391666 RepID=UPI0039A60DFA